MWPAGERLILVLVANHPLPNSSIMNYGHWPVGIPTPARSTSVLKYTP